MDFDPGISTTVIPPSVGDTEGMTIADVTRELLVRYLDVWTPNVLHGAKRATFALGFDTADAASVLTAEAALRTFAEFDDMLRGRRLTYLVVGPHDDTDLAARLDAVQAEFGTSPNLAVHLAAGDARQSAAGRGEGRGCGRRAAARVCPDQRAADVDADRRPPVRAAVDPAGRRAGRGIGPRSTRRVSR